MTIWTDDESGGTVWSEDEAGGTALGAEGGSALVGFIHSGSGAVARTAQAKMREALSPYDFGGIGDGATNDSAAVLAACVAAVAQSKDVDFGGGTWLLGTQIALTSAHNGLRWHLRGATIKKGFSGDLVTITTCNDFCIDGVGTFDGQHGTYTGKGFVFSGASDNPYFGAGLKFTSFTDSHIQFGADSGKRAKVHSKFLPGSGQTDARYIHCTGTDTAAMNRNFSEVECPAGYIDLDSAFDTVIGNAAFRRVEINSGCNITLVANCIWGNSGVAMTISGGATLINGGRFSGAVTLDSNFSGVFSGHFTSGSLVNSSANAIILGEHPASKIIATSAVSASVGVTTDETALVTIDLAAGQLGANDGLKITTYWSWTSGANDKTPRVRFGADGAGLGGTLAGNYVATTTNSGVLETLIHNRNNTASQRTVASIIHSGGALLTVLSSATIDTTAATEIVISGQKEVDSETMTLQGYTVELLDS